jgi:hypothetical protein
MTCSTIPEVDDLRNYVYEAHQGGASFVYHIETGVAFKVQTQVSQFLEYLHSTRSICKEFQNVAAEHLLTEKAIKYHNEPWVDDNEPWVYDSDDPDDSDDPNDDGNDDADDNDNDDDDKDDPFYSHGTCTAGKALGTEFGASKKATLIVVRLHRVDNRELEAALALILQDLNNHPERRKRSVVTMSLTLTSDWDEDEKLRFTNLAQQLLEKDVPFVCNAGNIEEEFPSREIDEYPQLLGGPELPLIVVASVDSTGNLSEFSKTGPQVTIHAVGKDIECLGKEDADILLRDGTSFGKCSISTCLPSAPTNIMLLSCTTGRR